MRRPRGKLVLIPALAICVVMGALLAGGGSVFAARKGGDEVTCKVVGKHRVSCPKKELRGKRGKRGMRGMRGGRGPAGLPGPAGPQGVSGAGSGLNLNFNANLNANEVKQLVIGNFTVRAAADATGGCVNIKLIAGAVDSSYSVGPAGAYNLILNNEVRDLQSGNTSNMFTAVSQNGVSTVSGIVGRVSTGGRCLVSGYVTGQ